MEEQNNYDDNETTLQDMFQDAFGDLCNDQIAKYLMDRFQTGWAYDEVGAMFYTFLSCSTEQQRNYVTEYIKNNDDESYNFLLRIREYC